MGQSESQSGWIVVLSRAQHPEALAIAKALAAVRKTPVQDQMALAKRAWGILAESLSEPDAKTLVELLSAAGLPCRAIAQSEMAVLPEIQTASAWSPELTQDLTLIACAAIPVTTTRTQRVQEGPTVGQRLASAGILLTTGLPIKIGGSSHTVEKVKTESDLRFVMDLYRRSPERRYRIEANAFDYSFLKERKQYQLLANFRLLLTDILQAAPGVPENWGCEVLRQSRPIQSMGYEDLHDLERECRWLKTLRLLEGGTA